MRRFLLCLLLAPLFITRAWAEEPATRALEIFDAGAMERLLSAEERAVSGGVAETLDAAPALARVWRSFLGKLRTNLEGAYGFLTELLVLTFVCGGARALCPTEKIAGLIEICGACAAAALLVGNVTGLVDETARALYRLSDYSKAALPVVYTAAAASGAVGSAPVRYAASALALDVMMSLAQRAVLPLIYASLALALTNAVFPHPVLLAVEALARWMAKTALTASCLAFTAYLGVSAAVSASADAAAIKATKTLLSTALPVVGGMLSDASAAVLSAAGVVRSCTGAFGLICVLILCTGPFALLTVKNLLFKAAAAVAESVQSPRLGKLFSAVGSAVSLLMGLLGSCALMLFLALSLGMKAVGAA